MTDAGGPDRRALRQARRARQAEREAHRAGMRALRDPARLAYGRGFLDGICAAMRPGDVAVDCGANVGDVAARLAATGARVIAYEPDPEVFALLRARLGALENVTLIEKGVGAQAGGAILRRLKGHARNPRAASLGNTVMEGVAYADPENTVAIEIADLAADLRAVLERTPEIALLKIDIEGAELDVLPALEAAGLLGRIRCTLVETHEVQMPHLADRFAALRASIAARHPRERVNLDWI